MTSNDGNDRNEYLASEAMSLREALKVLNTCMAWQSRSVINIIVNWRSVTSSKATNKQYPDLPMSVCGAVGGQNLPKKRR